MTSGNFPSSSIYDVQNPNMLWKWFLGKTLAATIRDLLPCFCSSGNATWDFVAYGCRPRPDTRKLLPNLHRYAYRCVTAILCSMRHATQDSLLSYILDFYVGCLWQGHDGYSLWSWGGLLNAVIPRPPMRTQYHHLWVNPHFQKGKFFMPLPEVPDSFALLLSSIPKKGEDRHYLHPKLHSADCGYCCCCCCHQGCQMA